MRSLMGGNPRGRNVRVKKVDKIEMDEIKKRHPGRDIVVIDDKTLASIKYITKHYPKDDV